jgi:hypothetical protein
MHAGYMHEGVTQRKLFPLLWRSSVSGDPCQLLLMLSFWWLLSCLGCCVRELRSLLFLVRNTHHCTQRSTPAELPETLSPSLVPAAVTRRVALLAVDVFFCAACPLPAEAFTCITRSLRPFMSTPLSESAASAAVRDLNMT